MARPGHDKGAMMTFDGFLSDGDHGLKGCSSPLQLHGGRLILLAAALLSGWVA